MLKTALVNTLSRDFSEVFLNGGVPRPPGGAGGHIYFEKNVPVFLGGVREFTTVIQARLTFNYLQTNIIYYMSNLFTGNHKTHQQAETTNEPQNSLRHFTEKAAAVRRV